nr:immunoglobulin heavy chain junction region [Macaca mulatta]MOX59974.1 immunoglobulin heavy chain junction region [Macaca mulatta]MOX60103.1 immunoglobulin heavy chain junction region [Macaca mulatta]MOX60903.1 immunoglobulin heavy chain junction region [Macaca mulatta]MOX61075.1 immunoglobulin heavy chain junction region [Macaca mulatta]
CARYGDDSVHYNFDYW